MTLKLADLEDFMKIVRNDVYPNHEIHKKKLNLLIAKHFGISDYVQKNIAGKLLEFGYLRVGNVNMFEIPKDGKK